MSRLALSAKSARQKSRKSEGGLAGLDCSFVLRFPPLPEFLSFIERRGGGKSIGISRPIAGREGRRVQNFPAPMKSSSKLFLLLTPATEMGCRRRRRVAQTA